MGAVVESIGDAIGDAVETVGNVVEDAAQYAGTVMEAVADNPVLIVAAIAVPELLPELVALAGVGEAAIVGEALIAGEVAADVLTVAETVAAVEEGAAILEATGEIIATSSAEQAAASTIFETMGVTSESLEFAAEASELVDAGASVGDAISTVTDGAIQPNAITEIANSGANTTFDNALNAAQNVSDGAKSFMQRMGETILPDADPMVQKFVAQTAVNTAVNGGDFERALEGSALSLGTGFIGSEVAAETGSKLAGNVASNVVRGVVSGGDPTRIAENIGTGIIGGTVADETGSQLAGKVTNAVLNSAVRGTDPTNALMNIGASTLINGAIGTVKDFASDLGKTTDTQGTADVQGSDNQSAVPKEVQDLFKSTEISTAGGVNTPQGGLGQVSDAEPEGKVTVTGLSQEGLNPQATTDKTDIGAIQRAGNAEVNASEKGIQTDNPDATNPAKDLYNSAKDAYSSVKDTFNSINPLSPLGIASAAATGLVMPQVRGMINGAVNNAINPNVPRPTGALNQTRPQMPTPPKNIYAQQNIQAPAPRAATPQVSAPRPAPAPVAPRPVVTAPARPAVPTKMDVSKLTPITNISGLSAMLLKKKQALANNSVAPTTIG